MQKDVIDLLKNKIRGCLLGGAIGDALGYQIEFDIGVREKQVTRFKNDFGIISDDTQMTLFTAVSLIANKTQSIYLNSNVPQKEQVRDGYLDWFDTQTKKNRGSSTSWIKTIPALNNRRAPGTTCLTSLANRHAIGSIQSPINNSNGCGSVMRIAPCGIFENDPEKAGLLAAECAAITHGNKLAWISSYVCASMVSLLIHNDTTIEKALLQSIQLLENHEKLFYENQNGFFSLTPLSQFMTLVDRAIYLSKEPTPELEAIRYLGEGWNADEALAIALYACLKHSNDFEDAVVCAVNHDGDSDSTGAIAGNIIGAFLGIGRIPSYYKENIELRDVVLEIADDLYMLKVSTYDMCSENWKRKYIDCNQK